MIEHRIVEYDGDKYIVDNEGDVWVGDMERRLRNDAKAYPKIIDKAIKKDCKVVQIKDWTEYGNIYDLTVDERQELKELLQERMTGNELKFAHEYILGEYSGNQGRSYLKAFNLDEENYSLAAASNMGGKLMKKEYIRKYTQILLREAGFNMDAVDAQLHQLIYQEDDKRVKLEAIKEWNRLHQRIQKHMRIEGNIQHNHSPMDLTNLNDNELEALYDIVKKLKDDNDNEIEVIED